MRHISELFKGFAKQKTYGSQIQSPDWIARSKEFLRTHRKCNSCRRTNVVLHVHHLQYYKGRNLWEYGDHELVALCASCHEVAERTIKEWRHIVGTGNATGQERIAAMVSELIRLYGETNTMFKLKALL